LLARRERFWNTVPAYVLGKNFWEGFPALFITKIPLVIVEKNKKNK